MDVERWAEDVINSQGPYAGGVFAALDAKARALEKMVDSYIALGDPKLCQELNPEWARVHVS